MDLDPAVCHDYRNIQKEASALIRGEETEIVVAFPRDDRLHAFEAFWNSLLSYPYHSCGWLTRKDEDMASLLTNQH